LGIAEENSGKLVSLVRTEAKKLAAARKRDLVIIDGSPGIGCPVIASITSADLVLVVTEPTLSGLHDLDRVAELTGHFGIKTLVCVNKWDLNADLSSEIERRVGAVGADMVGRVRYDTAVTEAMVHKQAVVEYTEAGAAADVKNIWSNVSDRLNRVSPFAIL
jgi:MinD superfamily P-loop ATPase